MKRHIELTAGEHTLRGYLDLPKGEGPHPLLIMFHGFTGDCTEHKFLLTRLAGELKEHGTASLRLSFSGSGESDGDFFDTSCLTQAKEGRAILDFARNLQGIDAARIGLLGMSMGGCSGVLVAKERPADVKCLILLAPAFRYVEKYRQRYDEDGVLWHGNLRVGRQFLEDGLKADLKGALMELKIPVCFFHGTNDTSVDPEVSKEFLRYAQTGRLTLIEGADHGFDTKEGIKELFSGVCAAAREFL